MGFQTNTIGSNPTLPPRIIPTGAHVEYKDANLDVKVYEAPFSRTIHITGRATGDPALIFVDSGKRFKIAGRSPAAVVGQKLTGELQSAFPNRIIIGAQSDDGAYAIQMTGDL